MSVAEDIAELALDHENPWPGLISFSEEAEGFYHGRSREVTELLRLVKRASLTVLFAQSGLGKTSLLRAGLFPRLRHENYLPVYLRLDHRSQVPLMRQVTDAIGEHCRDNGVEAPEAAADETLWEYFHRDDVDFWGARNQVIVPVLVFDQFEELFTRIGNGRGACEDFLVQLADLVEDRPPAAVRQRLEDQPDSIALFDFGKRNFKIIMSFREDFLPHFEGLRRDIPSIMTNRMRLMRMNGEQAREVILGPGAHLVDEDAADRIIRFVAGPTAANTPDQDFDRLEIEPALLSVVCRELNNQRHRRGAAKVTAEMLGGTQNEIIGEFYRGSLADMDARMRNFIEDRLVTITGYRQDCPLDDAVAQPGVTREAVDKLVDRRLLRIEERLGTARVELSHDLLTAVVIEERDERQKFEAHLRLEAQQQRSLRRSRRMTLWAVSAVAALTVLVGIVWTDKLAIKRERDNLNYERQLLLSNLSRTLLEIAEKHRLTPGSIDIIESIITDTGKLSEKFVADLKRQDIADTSSAEILRASNLLLHGDVNILRGRLGDGLRHFDEATRLLEPLATIGGEDIEARRLHVEALRKTGYILRMRGKHDLAETSYRRALAHAQSLAGAFPDDDTFKRSVSLILSGLADTERDSGDLGTAVELYGQRLRRAEEELAVKPNSETWKREAANAHGRIGELALRRDDIDGAMRSFNLQLLGYQDLFRQDPTSIRYRVNVALANANIGMALTRSGQLDDARRHYSLALSTYDAMAQADPKNSNWQIQLGNLHHNLGQLAISEDHPVNAVQSFRNALAYREGILAGDPENEPFRTKTAQTLEAMAAALERMKSFEEALAAYRRARDRLDAGDAAAIDRIDARIRVLEVSVR